MDLNATEQKIVLDEATDALANGDMLRCIIMDTMSNMDEIKIPD